MSAVVDDRPRCESCRHGVFRRPRGSVLGWSPRARPAQQHEEPACRDLQVHVIGAGTSVSLDGRATVTVCPGALCRMLGLRPHAWHVRTRRHPWGANRRNSPLRVRPRRAPPARRTSMAVPREISNSGAHARWPPRAAHDLAEEQWDIGSSNSVAPQDRSHAATSGRDRTGSTVRRHAPEAPLP